METITGPSFPQDYEQPFTLTPLDDDGKPAKIDGEIEYVGEGCDVNDISGFSGVATPKLAGVSGDVIAVTQNYLSEGTPTSQRLEFTLMAGGAKTTGATFGDAVPSTRRT